ncbi:hypothetical protein L2E82_06229 [Cichorium intybus]|uniref:Uncharacterized protein n=1 Tax=Cichorium intybus TaxID=13427 RepID=A0ACB9H9G1_CICIN|nr:hypothetical protein L2E82_06229 [Cichorium intybus]
MGDGWTSVVGISEYDELWSPVNQVTQPVPPSYFDPDEDDDDEEGISDTMMGDDVSSEDDSASVAVDDVLEEGEIREEDDEIVAESKLDGGCPSAGDSVPPAPDSGIEKGVINVHRNSEHISREVQPPFVFNAKIPTDDGKRLSNRSGADAGDCPVKMGSFSPVNELIKKGCFGPFSSHPHNAAIAPTDPHPTLSKFLDQKFSGSFIKRRRIHYSPNIGHGDHFTSSPEASVGELSPSVNCGDGNSSPPLPPLPPSPAIDLNTSPCHSTSKAVDNSQPPIPNPHPPISEIKRTVEIGQLIGFNIREDDMIIMEVMGDTGGQLNLK